MFLFDLTYRTDLAEVERVLPEHIRYLDTFYKNGLFVCSGRKNPRTGGIIVCACTNRAEAEAITQQDPFLIKGIASYSIQEFLPTKYAPAFEPFVREDIS